MLVRKHCRLRFVYVAISRAKPYALGLFMAVMLAWAGAYLLATATRPAILIEEEAVSVISWNHTLASGGVIHVEVRRRDYETEALYDAAVAAKLLLYPPDPPPEP